LKLFRSSRPDLLTVEEVNKFLPLNIRSVVDLRSASEYRKADGLKLLDAVYPVYKVLELRIRSLVRPYSENQVAFYSYYTVHFISLPTTFEKNCCK